MAWTDMEQAIGTLAQELSGRDADWLVGGSCGLVLQGVQVNKEPRDLDVYADQEDAETVAQALKPYSVDRRQYSETDIYRSVLSHYRIGSVELELVGGFQIIAPGSVYTVKATLMKRQYAEVRNIAGYDVPLMPLAHELIFNLLRARRDRYEAIAAAMRDDYERHRPALEALLHHNTLVEGIRNQIRELLGLPYPQV